MNLYTFYQKIDSRNSPVDTRIPTKLTDRDALFKKISAGLSVIGLILAAATIVCALRFKAHQLPISIGGGIPSAITLIAALTLIFLSQKEIWRHTSVCHKNARILKEYFQGSRDDIEGVNAVGEHKKAILITRQLYERYKKEGVGKMNEQYVGFLNCPQASNPFADGTTQTIYENLRKELISTIRNQLSSNPTHFPKFARDMLAIAKYNTDNEFELFSKQELIDAYTACNKNLKSYAAFERAWQGQAQLLFNLDKEGIITPYKFEGNPSTEFEKLTTYCTNIVSS